MPNQPPVYLFVYGTLRQNSHHPAHKILNHYCSFHSFGFLPGLLYEIDGYPGAIHQPHAQQRIHGELFHIQQPQPLFHYLDDYEGCSNTYPHPQEYRRESRRIESEHGELLNAWVYLYNHPLQSHQRIPSGDYLQFIQTKEQS